jgi:elongation factor 2
VCFSAGLHAWAFSIPQFAKTYAAKTSTPYDKWLERLWGEHFLDPKGKWQKQKTNDNTRGFVKFIYQIIYDVISAAMNDQKDKLMTMMTKLGVDKKLSAADKELMGKPLMKRVMQVCAACCWWRSPPSPPHGGIMHTPPQALAS